MNRNGTKPLLAQTTSHLLMIRPYGFGFNEQTAMDNAFQAQINGMDSQEVQQHAIAEFDQFVDILREIGIRVTVIEDDPQLYTPDAVFPNNWISFHQDGAVITYPMFAPARRSERRKEIWEKFLAESPDRYWVDLSAFEQEEKYLEGTGSMVLDRVNRVAYACTSSRTHPELFRYFCDRFGWEGVLFDARDEKGQDIYHTNVMMAIGTSLAVICLDSVPDAHMRRRVQSRLEQSGHEIVPISFHQLSQFAGNMLEVTNEAGKSYMVMSARAYASLEQSQRAIIHHHAEIISVPLNVIETCGGGSVRCMMAEIF